MYLHNYSKGMQALKICSKKILQFLVGRAH